MVAKIEGFFDALHIIILSFFTRLGVFTPAMVNGILVGYAVYTASLGLWGDPTIAKTAGIVMGLAMEAAGIGLSWNLDWKSKSKAKWFIVLYVLGSWVLVWLGLNDGWLLRIAGSVMPVFAVALQGTIATRKLHQEEVNEKVQAREQRLAYMKEQTKQAQADARKAKAQAGGTVKASKEEALAFLREHTEMGASEAAAALGITRQTVHNYRVNGL